MNFYTNSVMNNFIILQLTQLYNCVSKCSFILFITELKYILVFYIIVNIKQYIIFDLNYKLEM